MGYSEDEGMVRVDFFKETGKWYTTEAVKWTGGYDCLDIHTAFEKSLRDHFTKTGKVSRLTGMTAVCLNPYHEHSHPLMTIWGGK
jgi:hypothetical protein